MSSIFSLLSGLFQPTKKKPRALLSEADLEQLKMNDDYIDKRRIKSFAFLFGFLAILFLAYVFGYAVINEKAVHDKVVGLITDNISGIIFFILSLVGVNILTKSNEDK